VIEERALLDGGQTAEQVAARLVAWLGEAHRSLDIALYDVRLPGAVGDVVAEALRDAAARGVAVRIAFNQDGDRAVKPLPPPPRTDPSLLETLGVPLQAIPATPTSCTTSTSCAISRRCGPGRRIGRSTRGRARRT
jgi:hypothetical protein